jgi:hypothetical protein
MSNILKGLQLNELSNDTLASYKKKAGADATAADKQGDTKKADKRFSGIVKATKKQFANDEKQLKEFAPVGGDDREPDEEEILRQLAAKWYHGDEDPKAERTLEMMGWEIGHVESGDDDAGVFVVRAGDENGNSYIAFNQSDLNLNEVYNNYHANRTGFSRGQRDDERHDLDKPTQVWGLKINGKVWSKGGADVTFTSKQAALNARNAILKNKPDLEIGLVTKGGVAEGEGNFAGDTPVNLGGVTVKRLQVGDIVKYFGQKAKILAMSKTGNTSRITIANDMGGVTKDVLTSDLKRTSVDEARYDTGDYYNARQGYEYGARSPSVDSGAYEFEKNVPAGEPGGERGRPKNLKGSSKSLPADAFGRTTGKIPSGKPGRIHSMMRDVDEELAENLNKWFKEKWVRFGPDGKIRGDCARGDDSEGKPKCLPQSKAHSLGKKGRASAASRKRREDPNPERSGKAINVNTKKKTDEEQLDELKCWSGYHRVAGTKAGFPGSCAKNKTNEEGLAEGWKEESQELEDWTKEVNMRLYKAHENQRHALARQLSKVEQKHFGSKLTNGPLTNIVFSTLQALNKGQMVHYDPQRVGQMPFGNLVGDDARIIASAGVSSDELAGYRMLSDKGIVDNIQQFLKLRRVVWNKNWPQEYLDKFAGRPGALWLQFVKDLNWSKDDMNEEVQAKTDDKLLAYYAQRKAEKEKQQGVAEEQHSCPHCGGEMVSEELMNEKKDACYYKVKSRYKVWPSAYASGALVKCRKKGADSWGNGGKKNESIEEDQLDEKWTKKYKDSINCSNPKGFSQKAHCAGKQKNESAIMKGLSL